LSPFPSETACPVPLFPVLILSFFFFSAQRPLAIRFSSASLGRLFFPWDPPFFTALPRLEKSFLFLPSFGDSPPAKNASPYTADTRGPFPCILSVPLPALFYSPPGRQFIAFCGRLGSGDRCPLFFFFFSRRVLWGPAVIFGKSPRTPWHVVSSLGKRDPPSEKPHERLFFLRRVTSPSEGLGLNPSFSFIAPLTARHTSGQCSYVFAVLASRVLYSFLASPSAGPLVCGKNRRFPPRPFLPCDPFSPPATRGAALFFLEDAYAPFIHRPLPP